MLFPRLIHFWHWDETIICYVNFHLRSTACNHSDSLHNLLKCLVVSLQEIWESTNTVYTRFPRCYPLKVRQDRKYKSCTFPSLFQVMKKPYSSTFMWQLGSNMYGSCRDKGFFNGGGGGSYLLGFYLTWKDIKQPTWLTHTWQTQHKQTEH